jgi:hypothetical protein
VELLDTQDGMPVWFAGGAGLSSARRSSPTEFWGAQFLVQQSRLYVAYCRGSAGISRPMRRNPSARRCSWPRRRGWPDSLMGFTSGVAEWARRISLHLDGFSNDGQHIFGVISCGAKPLTASRWETETFLDPFGTQSHHYPERLDTTSHLHCSRCWVCG